MTTTNEIYIKGLKLPLTEDGLFGEDDEETLKYCARFEFDDDEVDEDEEEGHDEGMDCSPVFLPTD